MLQRTSKFNYLRARLPIGLCIWRKVDNGDSYLYYLVHDPEGKAPLTKKVEKMDTCYNKCFKCNNLFGSSKLTIILVENGKKIEY